MKNFITQNYFKIQILIIGAFIILCALHFFSARPIWLDENMVLKSLVAFEYKRIFGVLLYEQAYPRVHLAIIKFLAEHFNFHVFSLRFVSFISMIAAVIVWWRIYRREIKGIEGVLVCLLAFMCSYRMVYYAAELKPYSMDVLGVGLYVLFILRQKQIEIKGVRVLDFVLVCLLPFLNLFSYAVFFIFWLVPFNFLLMSIKNKKLIPIFIISSLAAIAAIATLYYTDLQFVLNSKARQGYWESYFICSESIGCFFKSYGEGSKRLVTFWFGNTKAFVRFAIVFIPFAWVALFRYGFSGIKNAKGKILDLSSVGFILMMELFIFGILHKYPFTGDRITLYLAPFIFYFIYRGITALPYKPARLFFLFYYVLFCIVCAFNTFYAQIRLY